MVHEFIQIPVQDPSSFCTCKLLLLNCQYIKHYIQVHNWQTVTSFNKTSRCQLPRLLLNYCYLCISSILVSVSRPMCTLNWHLFFGRLDVMSQKYTEWDFIFTNLTIVFDPINLSNRLVSRYPNILIVVDIPRKNVKKFFTYCFFYHRLHSYFPESLSCITLLTWHVFPSH